MYRLLLVCERGGLAFALLNGKLQPLVPNPLRLRGVNRAAIGRHAPARGVNAERRRRGDGGRVLRVHPELLTEARDGRGRDALGKTLVVYLRHVVDAQAALARRDVCILAAQLNAEHFGVALVLVDGFKFSPARDELLEVV